MKLLVSILLAFAITATSVEGQRWLKTFKFKFYYGNGFQDYDSSGLQSVVTNPNFVVGRPIVLYFYGRTENATDASVVAMKNAYVNANYNFILFEVGRQWYDYNNINAITLKIAENVIALFNAGQFAQLFEMVGFARGAQYAGATGRQIRAKSTGVIAQFRIVGLEPEKKGIKPKVTLGPDDAAFVMTIHTGTAFSDPKIIGHAAFYPNGGITQPFCGKYVNRRFKDEKVCSHMIVQEYWIEAVTSENPLIFPSRQCGSYKDFYDRNCDGADIEFMNPQTSSLVRGLYYLATFNTPPYSKTFAEP